MSTQLIKAFPDFVKEEPSDSFLRVSEFFCDTIQGEGIHIGHPATFLRFQGCELYCIYCDTKEVWRQGNPYSFDELYTIMSSEGLPNKLLHGQHLVITGGSPLLQQNSLYWFLTGFIAKFGFKPYIEVENECVIPPNLGLQGLVDCWNNSPKLASSGVSSFIRIKNEVLYKMSNLQNSWFKFVIGKDDCWCEINDLIEAGLIRKEQVILMPEGATREEIAEHKEAVLNMAIQHGVRYSDRLHIQFWNREIGV